MKKMTDKAKGRCWVECLVRSPVESKQNTQPFAFLVFIDVPSIGVGIATIFNEDYPRHHRELFNLPDSSIQSGTWLPTLGSYRSARAIFAP